MLSQICKRYLEDNRIQGKDLETPSKIEIESTRKRKSEYPDSICAEYFVLENASSHAFIVNNICRCRMGFKGSLKEKSLFGYLLKYKNSLNRIRLSNPKLFLVIIVILTLCAILCMNISTKLISISHFPVGYYRLILNNRIANSVIFKFHWFVFSYQTLD